MDPGLWMEDLRKDVAKIVTFCSCLAYPSIQQLIFIAANIVLPACT